MGQPSSGIGVVDKSVSILAAVAAGPTTLAELVSATGLPRATAHRLAVALETHRLIARDVEGRFILGPRIGEFAHALPDALVVAAGPVLSWVRDECGTSRTLSEVRRRGWAQSVAQREAGVASVSAPVFAPNGHLLAAISISGPIQRLGRTPGTRFAPVLVAGAKRIIASLSS